MNVESTDVVTAAPGDYDLRESVAYLVARLRSVMHNMLNQRTVQELGITGTQAAILVLLATGRCRNSADLAREQNTDASAITRLIDRLERRAILTRIRGCDDRRVVRLELTDEGRALSDRIPPLLSGVIDDLLSNLSSEETAFLKGMLRRMLFNAGPACAYFPAENSPGLH